MNIYSFYWKKNSFYCKKNNKKKYGLINNISINNITIFKNYYFPHNVERFECLEKEEKRYINVMNYYYYLSSGQKG